MFGGLRPPEAPAGASLSSSFTRAVGYHQREIHDPIPLGCEQHQGHGGAQHFPTSAFTGLVGNEQGSAKKSVYEMENSRTWPSLGTT